jgi:hypothetical protein
MIEASLADIASLAVEVRLLAARVAALETPARRRSQMPRRQRLEDRLLELARQRGVVAGRELIRALAAEGALAEYIRPDHTVWQAIMRAVDRGHLRRVARGYYKIGDRNGAQP